MNVNLESNFTSTGEKLLLWPEILARLQKERLPTPINIQIAPTNTCNLNCWFCSVANRDKSLSLSLGEILKFVDQLSTTNTVRAVEITGGGEPTTYPYIEDLISALNERDLSIGLVTNGLQLCDAISEPILKKLTWIRISMNTLEDTGKIDIPTTKGPILGFSYVWGKSKPDSNTFLRKLVRIAKSHNIEYIRLVPNCREDVTLVKDRLKKIASSIGSPIFLQEKTPSKPNECYLGYIKPFLYSDGFVYPCNSISLHTKANLDFPQEIAMFPINKAATWMQTKILSGCINPHEWSYCNSCRFTNQNNLLSTVLSKKFKHKEHV